MFHKGQLVLVSTPDSRFAPAQHKLLRVATVSRKGAIETVITPKTEIARGVPFGKIAAEFVRPVEGSVSAEALANVPSVFDSFEDAVNTLRSVGLTVRA